LSKNWWAAVWTEKMERLAERTRFAEGAAYLTMNKIQRCRIEGRTVIATIQGPTESPYTVRITFGAFTREQWDQLFANVRDLRSLASSLAAGDLLLEVQTAFSKAKLRFMPERYVDLHLECGCTDWLKPCKHLVAAWLKFGREFERDPLLLFQLRGMDRNELFALLRGGEAPVAGPDESETQETIEEEIVPVKREPLPADPEAFWAAPALPAVSPGAGERRLSDEDVFEKLGPAPFANWHTVEPQFHRVYDAVYEFASILLKK
jgi:uncharacterized Zn finger protein